MINYTCQQIKYCDWCTGISFSEQFKETVNHVRNNFTKGRRVISESTQMNIVLDVLEFQNFQIFVYLVRLNKVDYYRRFEFRGLTMERGNTFFFFFEPNTFLLWTFFFNVTMNVLNCRYFVPENSYCNMFLSCIHK